MPSFNLRAFAKEQVCFLAVSFAVFSTEPAIVHAQAGDIAPLPFTQALNLSRGSVSPGSAEGVYLTLTDACKIAMGDWGWDSCDGLDAMIVQHLPGVDTTLIDKPNSDGFVTYEDWEGGDRDAAIAQIETELASSLKAQGEKTGQDIAFKGWRVYPTLDVANNRMVYATDSTWNGDPVINIKATVFDRRGYVVFSIVPVSDAMTELEIRNMVDATLAAYLPAPDETYTSFVSGDKVAAAGAIGVLATLVGVKYGKAAVGGIIAAALLFLKKGAFLVLLPIAWVVRKLRGKKSDAGV